MKCGTDTRGVQRINSTDFTDHLTFHLVTPAVKFQHLQDELAQNAVQMFIITDDES